MTLPKITGVTFGDHPLWAREQIMLATFHQHGVALPEPRYAVVWEDPDDVDAPAKVTVPSPAWLAMALHGDILPPVEVYHALADDEAQPGFRRHTRGHLLHDTPPVAAMTEEEAMEYLIQKDLPRRVWCGYKGNRETLKVVPRGLIPTDRTHRNAWRITQIGETA